MNKYVLISVFVLTLLACGVTTTGMIPLPTNTVAPTPPRKERPVTEKVPHVMVVCVETANVRDAEYKVVGQVLRGQTVTLTGAEIRAGAEIWQPTDKGLIDPKLICEVK